MAGVADAAWVAPVLTLAGTIATATITAYVTLRLGRRKEKAEVQVTLNEGFKILVQELQEERDKLMEVVRKQGEEITVLRGELWQTQQKLASLENILAQRGISLH